MATLKKGDRVRVANYPASYWCGEGTIDLVYDGGVVINYGDGKRGYIGIKYIEALTDADPVAEWDDEPAIDATTDAAATAHSTAGFTVPLCAYDEEQSFEWLLDRMADAYQRGFKDGLSAQLTR